MTTINDFLPVWDDSIFAQELIGPYVISGTWADYKKSSGRRFASRSNIHDATDFMGWYMQESRRRLGIKMSDTKNQYLAYHEGHGGFERRSFRKKSWLKLEFSSHNRRRISSGALVIFNET